MEDVVVAKTRCKVPARETGRAALFCVFDGHGGRRCAEWAAEALPSRIFSNLGDPAKSWPAALAAAFPEADAMLWEKAQTYGREASGSTVLVALFDGRNKLYVASLGDCRAVRSAGVLEKSG